MPDDLAALEARVSKGFDWLFAREESNRGNGIAGTEDAYYLKWLQEWEGLLEDLQYRLTYLGQTKA